MQICQLMVDLRAAQTVSSSKCNGSGHALPTETAFGLPWQPSAETAAHIERLAHRYRSTVRETLAPVVHLWHPALAAAGAEAEYAKMIELSTKMALVGHACAGVADREFDKRRLRIAILFGCCCFLADSFLDDFGPEATRIYLQRLNRLVTTGWFEISGERERLFYVVVSRLFGERDMLDPFVRQAIVRLQSAQELDVMLRLEPQRLSDLSQPRQLALLKRTARDRSGYAILLLTSLLAAGVPLRLLTLIFNAGALIMFIDDHGDCFTDRREGRLTYMNRVRNPERVLRRIAHGYFARLAAGLPQGEGRDLLLGFLLRYFLSRLEKHREQRQRVGTAWDVYE
jgi:hypothetical protein